ncbi:hypothetical protein [Acidovorax sp. Leaf73]|uniref:hypothetical protein n=1 Tax=Acidovorax sp. Leaf73 TaxID=2876566 RepID=UPI001E56DF7E|nr:hypothetical protein [Acidovorax sp. Leaf73]
MNIRELKRRLQPYSGYMKTAEDGGADGGGTATDEKPDMGNDLDPEPIEAQAAAADGGGAGDTPTDDNAEADGEDGADGQGGKRSVGIPKARFNEVNEERKEALRKLEAAEEELKRLRAATEKPAATAPAPSASPAAASDDTDIDAKEQEYTEALYAGDSKKAAAIRREINAQLVQQATAQAREVAATEFTARESKTLLQAAVQTAVAAYPWLNDPEGADALDLILAARDQRISKGMPAHLALIEAVNKIAPKFAPDSDTPSRVSEKQEPAKDLRTPAAIARGLTDSDRQPAAAQAGIGNRATPNRIDWKALDEDQLAAVPKDELRKALGNA